MIQLEEREKKEKEKERERVLFRVGAHGSMTNSFLAQTCKPLDPP